MLVVLFVFVCFCLCCTIDLQIRHFCFPCFVCTTGLPSALGGRSQRQKNVSTKLGILFQELLKVTAVAERAEQLATNASAGSNDYMREADRQRVQEDFALRQSNELRALEQQIDDALGGDDDDTL